MAQKGGGKVSYSQLKIGTRDVLIEYRVVAVKVGSSIPTPTVGYSISAMIFTDKFLDFYLEYKEVEGIIQFT